MDPRVADKLKTQVTMHINQVPVETAARLLADMAGLRVIKVDTVEWHSLCPTLFRPSKRFRRTFRGRVSRSYSFGRRFTARGSTR